MFFKTLPSLSNPPRKLNENILSQNFSSKFCELLEASFGGEKSWKYDCNGNVYVYLYLYLKVEGI